MPPLGTYPRLVAAAMSAIIGAVAGLLGIGGGELRLPVLVSFLALSVKVAITVNLAISVATLGTGLIRRWDSGALDDIGGWGLLVAALLTGNLIGAALGVRSGHRARETKLARAMQLYLFGIGLLFIYETFFHFPHLDVSRDAPPALALGVVCGVAVGWVATVFGVAGGELRIPAPDLRVRRTDKGCWDAYSLIIVLGAASVVGATVGVALLPAVSDSALRLLLGTVLIASAARLHPAATSDPRTFARPS